MHSVYLTSTRKNIQQNDQLDALMHW